MGGERQDKKPNSQKHGTKKKQEGNGGEDQSGDKSFGGAGLGQKADTTKPRWKGKYVPGQYVPPTPRCSLCDVTGQPPAGHWTAVCPRLNSSQKATLKSKGVCLGCLRLKARPPAKHVCPEWLREEYKAEFCATC